MKGLIILLALYFGLAGCAASKVETTASSSKPNKIDEGYWQINGLKIKYRMIGSGKPLVLIHGGPGGNYLSWKSIEEMADHYRLIMYDQRGSGESERLPIDSKQPDPTLLSLERHVADLEEIRKQLNLEKMILMGHSWGGTLAGFYANQYPARIEKLILYDGLPYDPEDRKVGEKEINKRLSPELSEQFKKKLTNLEEHLTEYSQEQLDKLMVELVRPMFSAMSCNPSLPPSNEEIGRAGFWANAFAYSYLASFDQKKFAQTFAKVTAPALIIWGRCEPYPLTRAIEIRDLLPNSKLIILEGSGHQGLADQHDLFIQLIRAFLGNQPLPVNPQPGPARAGAAEPDGTHT